MHYYYEDGINVRTNSVTIIGGYGGYGNIAYNAVLDVHFSDDEEVEPVTLTEAKNWCRIDVSDDDDIITELITAARIICEQYSNISFIPRTVTARLKNPLGGIYLPYGPVTELASVTDDDLNELEIGDYTITGASFKQIKEPFTELTLVYTAGYELLPKNLKKAMLNQISWMYDNRGSDESAQISEQAKLILNLVRRVH